MRVKNHQMPPTIRVEAALGLRSEPCCIRVPTANQKLFARVKSFWTTNPVSTHGWGLAHSIGENLAILSCFCYCIYLHLPSHYPYSERHQNICQENIEPDLQCQRIHEAEQFRRLNFWFLKKYGNPQIHERFCEVYHIFPGISFCITLVCDSKD